MMKKKWDKNNKLVLNNNLNTLMINNYITIHYNTLQYITIHYNTIHYNTLQYINDDYINFFEIKLKRMKTRWTFFRVKLIFMFKCLWTFGTWDLLPPSNISFKLLPPPPPITSYQFISTLINSSYLLLPLFLPLFQPLFLPLFLSLFLPLFIPPLTLL